MNEIKIYYAEPKIRIFARGNDSIQHEFFCDLVQKYSKAIWRAVSLGGRYLEAVQLLLDMEWSMVYGSVMRDSTSKVVISRDDDSICVEFKEHFIY